MRHHVVITGTGRTGTTFLVQLLTALGLDTGLERVGDLYEHPRAGLESDIRHSDAPYVVKNPAFCDYAQQVVEDPEIVLDHVFVPIRDLAGAAQSRRHVVETTTGKIPPALINGGLVGTNDMAPGAQEGVLLFKLYRLLLALSVIGTPVTFIHYPFLTQDAGYLYDKLAPILSDVGYYAFTAEFNEAVDPSLVHQFSATDQ